MPFDLDPARLDAAESALGVRLPSEYRARMTRVNGGEVELEGEVWCLHPVFDDGDARRLRRTMSHLVHETGEARGWRGFPAEAIAIAANGAGDQLVLVPTAEEPTVLGGDVLRWDHETGELTPLAGGMGSLEPPRDASGAGSSATRTGR